MTGGTPILIMAVECREITPRLAIQSHHNSSCSCFARRIATNLKKINTKPILQVHQRCTRAVFERHQQGEARQQTRPAGTQHRQCHTADNPCWLQGDLRMTTASSYMDMIRRIPVLTLDTDRFDARQAACNHQRKSCMACDYCAFLVGCIAGCLLWHWQSQDPLADPGDTFWGLEAPMPPSRLPKASWNVCEEMPPSLPIPTCIRSDVLLRLTKSRLWICLCWDHVLQLTVEWRWCLVIYRVSSFTCDGWPHQSRTMQEVSKLVLLILWLEKVPVVVPLVCRNLHTWLGVILRDKNEPLD